MPGIVSSLDIPSPSPITWGFPSFISCVGSHFQCLVFILLDLCPYFYEAHLLLSSWERLLWEVKFLRSCTTKNVFILLVVLINSLFGSRILGWKFLSEFWRHCFCCNLNLFRFLFLDIWPPIFFFGNSRSSLWPQCPWNFIMMCLGVRFFFFFFPASSSTAFFQSRILSSVLEKFIEMLY